MASKFNENLIITGIIDSFCLACEEYLNSEEKNIKHIEKPKHNENASNFSKEANGQHCISKFKAGYYCVNCNVLLRTAIKLNFHVQIVDIKICNKTDVPIKRIDNVIIAFEDTLISDEAWNGFIDDSCVVCDMAIENDDEHLNKSTHILQLIQRRVVFGNDNTIYRELDDSFCQCLTCNVLVASNKISEHVNDSDHKKSYKKYIKPQSDIKKNDIDDNAESKAVGDSSKIQVDQNHNNVIDEKENKAKNDNCKIAVVKFVTPTASTSNSNETEDFAKSNDITYNKGNNKAYCRLCCKKLPATLIYMREHVNGANHKKKLAAMPSKTKVTSNSKQKRTVKQNFGYFIESLHVQSGSEKNVVVNERFCIKKLSFYLISKHGFRYRCQVCELNLPLHEVDLHMKSMSHQIAMKNIPVLISYESEFIREVRPGLFHCGYCNLIPGNQEDLENHLKCTSHRHNKTCGESEIPSFLREVYLRRHFQRLAFMSFLAHAFKFPTRYDSDDSDD